MAPIGTEKGVKPRGRGHLLGTPLVHHLQYRATHAAGAGTCTPQMGIACNHHTMVAPCNIPWLRKAAVTKVPFIQDTVVWLLWCNQV